MKNVLITGGSRGIGRACVEKFAREGYAVSFIYNNSDSAAAELSELTGAHAIKADVSKPEQAKEAVAKALSTMGGIDVLVNNAGISLIKLFTDTTDEDYYNIMNTNLGGTFFVTREVAKNMISNHFGRIVNIGSMWGKVGASCEVAYSAAKAGVIGLTKALAKELAPSGITVNCIAPGLIETSMNSNLTIEELSDFVNDIPLGRMGSADEIAAAIEFLASDKADYMTGQVLGINGGYVI